jgi:pantetheine-phosphate adenylyltransferase
MKTCVFAGTFDPLTNGHAFAIDSLLKMFDKVVVAIGVNVDKNPMFSLEDRKQMILNTYAGNDRVEVKEFGGMLVDFMKQNDILVNVRGIRDIDDYKYETTMERYNRDMYPEMITIYIPTPKDLVQVSSTAMRNIIELKGDCSKYIPKAVNDYILNLQKQQTKN